MFDKRQRRKLYQPGPSAQDPGCQMNRRAEGPIYRSGLLLACITMIARTFGPDLKARLNMRQPYWIGQ